VAKQREAEELLREGLCPSQIAKRQRVSFSTIKKYLFQAIGEGRLKHSDVYLSVPESTRNSFEQIWAEEECTGRVPWPKLPDYKDAKLEFELLSQIRKSSALVGDLYQFIAESEIRLHRLVEERLRREFGGGDAWWIHGVTQAIRIKCVTRREEEKRSNREFCYTTLIDLKEIIDKQWKLFETELPPCWSSRKADFRSDMDRLNRIRNAVMHPVKDSDWTNDDLQFIRRIHRAINQ